MLGSEERPRLTQALLEELMRVVSALAVALVCGHLGSSPALAAQRAAAAPQRQRPLAGFTCAPDALTSYTGVVVRYTRQTGTTTLRIKTDWDTVEEVALKHPGTDDPSALFRMTGAPFTAADWARIERSKGVLVPGTRASAWVCSDGQVMVDWGVASEAR